MELSWLKRLPLFPLVFTYVFVSSAGLVAVILVALSIVLWPFAKNTYRRVSAAIAYSVQARECVQQKIMLRFFSGGE